MPPPAAVTTRTRRAEGREVQGQVATLNSVCVAMCVLGVGASIAVYSFSEQAVQDHTQTKFDGVVDLVADSVVHSLGFVSGAAASIADLFELASVVDVSEVGTGHAHSDVSPVSRLAFDRIAGVFRSSRLSGLYWAPRVASDHERALWTNASLEAYPAAPHTTFWAAGAPVPPGSAPYFPLVFSFPVDTAPLEILVDASRDGDHAAGMQAAAESGEMALGAVAPVADGSRVVVAFRPVLHNQTRVVDFRDDAAADVVLGFVVVVLRIELIIADGLGNVLAANPNIWVRVTDEGGALLYAGGRDAAPATAPDTQRSQPPNQKPHATHTATVPVELLQRSWSIAVVEVDPMGEPAGAWWYLVAGVCTTLTSVALVRVLGTQAIARNHVLAQTLKAMHDFTAMASHDIRTPIRALDALGGQLLAMDLTPEQRACVEDQMVCQAAMQHKVNNVMVHEKMASGQGAKLVPNTACHVNLEELIAEVVHVASSYYHNPDVSVALHTGRSPRQLVRSFGGISPTSPESVRERQALMVHTDAQYVRQILLNLVCNALQFTRRGHVDVVATVSPVVTLGWGESDVRREKVWRRRSSVHAAASPPPPARAHSLGFRSSTWLQLEVHDTGVGFAPGEFATVFGCYSRPQSKRKALGLGLFAVHTLCSKLGGRCAAAPRLDGARGSVFLVSFPLETCAPPCCLVSAVPKRARSQHDEPARSDHAPSAPRARRCLVVDDMPINLRIASKALQGVGVAATCVTSGEEAIALLDEADKRARFEFVLMDVRMPKCSGVEAVQAIRRLEDDDVEENSDGEGAQPRRHLPVFGLTAGREDVVEECERAGMDAVLDKPVSIAELRHALELCGLVL